MSKQSKCMVTIKDRDLKIMIEADISGIGFDERWDKIRDIIVRHIGLGQKLESIVFFNDERVTDGTPLSEFNGFSEEAWKIHNEMIKKKYPL